MPFNELHQRRDSWPPTIVRLHNDPNNTPETEHIEFPSSAIDENPISFFLTAPDDLDVDDADFLTDEELSAGIETPDSDRSPVREISPSSLERERKKRRDRPLLSDDDEDEDEDFDYNLGLGVGLAIPMTLREFSARHSPGRTSRSSLDRPDDDKNQTKGLGIVNIPDFPGPSSPPSALRRGRPKVRLVPARAMRGRGMTRSLSARKPQSWREPSPEIFPIMEEDEDLSRAVVVPEPSLDRLVSASAPATSLLESALWKGGEKKIKKRVHWAI